MAPSLALLLGGAWAFVLADSTHSISASFTLFALGTIASTTLAAWCIRTGGKA